MALSPSSSWSADTAAFDDDIQAAVNRWWIDLPHWKLWKSQLKAESGLDPFAHSDVGAQGLAQIMPTTFRDLALALKFPRSVSAYDTRYAIEAGAYYDAQIRRTWRRGRVPLDAHWLAVASYNAGTGHILKAQSLCDNARLWPEIQPCLISVTGTANAKQTTSYVDRIAAYWRRMESTR